MNTSRFVTYPSTVETNLNHRVVLIDATEQELTQVERFLQTSEKNFDVYIYPSENYDLEWLNHASTDAELILINNASQVRVTPNGVRYQGSLIAHFEKIEQSVIDLNV
jgi:hypothetical protein